MNIETILQYQDIDKELFKLENELKNSDEAKKMLRYQGEHKKATDEMLSLNGKAEELFVNFKRQTEQYELLTKDIEELSRSVDENNDIKQLEFYSAKLEKCNQSLEIVENEIARITAELGNIQSVSKKEYENALKSQKGYQIFAEKFTQLKNEKSAQAKEYMIKLKELEKDIEPKILESYRRIRANKKMPVFVPLMLPNTCSGCRMTLANDIVGKLNGASIVEECPNCGRFIYKKAQE